VSSTRPSAISSTGLNSPLLGDEIGIKDDWESWGNNNLSLGQLKTKNRGLIIFIEGINVV
jgi:hypothetical protein